MTADFDDIEVDANGMCRWSDVANAQEIIRARIAALEAALQHIEALCFEATSYGHTDINRVLSVVARAALDKDARK